MQSANRKRQNAPAIVVPKPSEDQPRFGRVGLIAAAGFIIGIAWPGLAQLELVPRPPSDGAHQPAASASAAAVSSVPDQEGKPPVAMPESKGPGANAAVQPKVRFTEIVSCVDADGKKHRKCGALALDRVLVEPLRSLVACDGAEGQKGVLSLGFDIDFVDQKLSGFTVGRSTTLPSQVAEDLLGCAKSVLEKIELTGVEHGYNRYRVFYLVELLSSESAKTETTPEPTAAPSASADSDAEAEVQGASGRATVAWEVAMIRKSPKTGAIVARVLGGTRLAVTGRQGDWYRVKYDSEGHEGFVFKAAIGL